MIRELIIVDDSSTDRTFESINRTFSNISKVHVIRCDKEKLVSACRNLGLKQVQGEHIFFLDDDVVVSKEATNDLAPFLSHYAKVACVIPIIMYYNKPKLIWCAGIRHNFWTTHGVFIGYNEVDNGQFESAINSDSVITAFMVRKSVATKTWFDSKTFPIG